MLGGLQGCVYDKLRERFLEGTSGDCSLSFVQDGNVVEKRKCPSFVLEEVAYFAAQRNFAEGGSKEFSIDITQFYIGCKVSFKEFVESTFIILFDGTCAELDPSSKYAVVRFREYLGLSYADIFEGDLKHPNIPDCPQSLQDAVTGMLQMCTDEVADLIIEKHFNQFCGVGTTEKSFHEKYKIVIAAMDSLCVAGRLTPRGKKICVWLFEKYCDFGHAFDDEAVLKGFGSGLIRLIELMQQCHSNISFQLHQRFNIRLNNIVAFQHMFPLLGPGGLEPNIPSYPLLDDLKVSEESSVSEIQAMTFFFQCGCTWDSLEKNWSEEFE